jgi:hypothetical protein
MIEGGDGRILGAYSGSPIGIDVDETGERFIIIGELPTDRVASEADITKVPSGAGRILCPEIDVTGLTDRRALRVRVSTVLESTGLKNSDIVLLRFKGRSSANLSLDVPEELADRAAWMGAETSGLLPEHEVDFDASLPSDETSISVEEEFLKRMRERRRSASDEETRTIVEHAVYYGLDALRYGKVTLR